MSERPASLQREFLFALGNGSETTLLVLEMLNDPGADPALEETHVLQELTEMEAAHLVSRQTLPGPGKPEPGTGMPEHERGSAEVVWWELTEGGRAHLKEERHRQGL